MLNGKTTGTSTSCLRKCLEGLVYLSIDRRSFLQRLDAAKVGLTSIPHRIRTMSCGLVMFFSLLRRGFGTVATPVAQPKEDTKDHKPYYDICKIV